MKKTFLKSTRFHLIVGLCALLFAISGIMLIGNLIDSQSINDVYKKIEAFYVDDNERLYLLTDTLGILMYDSGEYIGRFNVGPNSAIINISEDGITICDYNNNALYVYDCYGNMKSKTNYADKLEYALTNSTTAFSSKQVRNGVVYELKCSNGYYEVYKGTDDVIYRTSDKGIKIKKICAVSNYILVFVFLTAILNIMVVMIRTGKIMEEKRKAFYSELADLFRNDK